MVNWYHLGLCLKVPDYRLQIIARNHPQDTEMCKIKMLSWWKDNISEQKWSTIVHALIKTGSRALACKIALNYGSKFNLIPSTLPPLYTLELFSTCDYTYLHTYHFIYLHIDTLFQVFQFQVCLKGWKMLLGLYKSPLKFVFLIFSCIWCEMWHYKLCL